MKRILADPHTGTVIEIGDAVIIEVPDDITEDSEDFVAVSGEWGAESAINHAETHGWTVKEI